MDSVLMVTGDASAPSLIQLLRDASVQKIISATSGNEARRLAAEGEYDAILINAPLPDEFGADFAIAAAGNTASGVLLLVKRELADEISARTESYGVLVVPKPVSRGYFYQALRLAEASRRRLLGLRQENARLQKRIEEIRLVDRAKCALIQYQGLTEPEAHHYMEKQAMDRRISRRAAAEEILAMYEGENPPGP